MNGVKKVAVAVAVVATVAAVAETEMNSVETVIADASNDSWTEGDPEMKKENLVSHEEMVNRRQLLMKRLQQQ